MNGWMSEWVTEKIRYWELNERKNSVLTYQQLFNDSSFSFTRVSIPITKTNKQTDQTYSKNRLCILKWCDQITLRVISKHMSWLQSNKSPTLWSFVIWWPKSKSMHHTKQKSSKNQRFWKKRKKKKKRRRWKRRRRSLHQSSDHQSLQFHW